MATERAATGTATDRFGIVESYHDASGRLHATPAATRAAILAAMGVGTGEAQAQTSPHWHDAGRGAGFWQPQVH